MSRNVQKDKNEDKSPLVGACCRLLTYNVCYFPHLCYSELWSLKIGDCNLNTCLIISKGTCIALINLLVHGKIKESYRNNSNSYEVAHSSQHNLSWFTCYSPEVQETQIFLFAFCILLVANIRVLQLALFMHTSPSTFLMDVAELMFQHKYLFHI